MMNIPLHPDVNPFPPSALGSAIGAKVRARARELALSAGRAPFGVMRADYQQARREVTGESDLDRQDAILDALPETKRWDPVPGSAGSQAPESPAEGEDAEGRSEAEQLFDDGVEAAARERVREAARQISLQP